MRYKGLARKIILALDYLYLEGLRFISDSGLIDRFGGLSSLYTLYRYYNYPISFLTRYLDYIINIYI